MNRHKLNGLKKKSFLKIFFLENFASCRLVIKTSTKVNAVGVEILGFNFNQSLPVFENCKLHTPARNSNVRMLERVELIRASFSGNIHTNNLKELN